MAFQSNAIIHKELTSQNVYCIVWDEWDNLYLLTAIDTSFLIQEDAVMC